MCSEIQPVDESLSELDFELGYYPSLASMFIGVPSHGRSPILTETFLLSWVINSLGSRTPSNLAMS